MMIFPAKIQVVLLIRRIISNISEIFRLERAQDVDSMKKLFSSCLASPNNSNNTGLSILNISYNPYKNPPNVSWFYRENLQLIQSFPKLRQNSYI